MKKLIQAEELVGKTIKSSSVQYEEDDSTWQKLVIETTDDCILVMQGDTVYDRCGDLDGINLEAITSRDDLEFDFAKKLGLYSEDEIKAFEDARRKKREEAERKAAYEKEQKRKQKEEAELKKLKELAEKFNLKIHE